MFNQPLRGLVAQGMDGRKASIQGALVQYSPGSYTFRPSKSGYWTFVLWGSGGSNDNGHSIAGSGALCIKTVHLDTSQSLPVVCAAPGSGASTVNLPSGDVVSAGGGSGNGGPGGTATGGDINLNGVAGGGGAGGNAPSSGDYRGGAGGGNAISGQSPGGGAGAGTDGGSVQGGSGLVMAFFLRA